MAHLPRWKIDNQKLASQMSKKILFFDFGEKNKLTTMKEYWTKVAIELNDKRKKVMIMIIIINNKWASKSLIYIHIYSERTRFQLQKREIDQFDLICIRGKNKINGQSRDDNSMKWYYIVFSSQFHKAQ